MRVIAGLARGRKLQVPQEGTTRPTPSRVREALFSSLGPRLTEARVLDLFAGSGALGIEALSRGAGTALFVDQAPKAAAVVRNNLLVLPAEVRARATVRVLEARRALEVLAQERLLFDLVLLDAPFAMGERAGERPGQNSADPLADILATLCSHSLLAADACIVVEHSSKRPAPTPPAGLTLARARTYGEVALASYVGYSTEL